MDEKCVTEMNTENKSEINVEEIMEQIRTNIRERGYDKIPLSFEDVPISQPLIAGEVEYDAMVLRQEVQYLNQNWNNNWNVPVSGGGLRAKFKKLIRKLTRFIIAPIVAFQNEYNASNVRAIQQLAAYAKMMDEYKLRIEELEQQVKELKQGK
ncbi:MAG: hypothetical protein IKO10_02840 [Lachnospiraceae bacterium]|nr:hypothetical protein [Lachnospiraceae bacterium]